MLVDCGRAAGGVAGRAGRYLLLGGWYGVVRWFVR